MLITIITFLIMLFILVIAHEFGHFILAKLSGVGVEEFAFGFPPRLASVKKGETRYSFNLVLLGGFVRLKGENGEDTADPRSFAGQHFYKKFFIIIAGVAFNLILAYVLISAGFMIGTPVPLEDSALNPNATIRLIEIQESSPAQKAGLQIGDTILQFHSANENIKPTKIQEVHDFIEKNKGKSIDITFEREGLRITKSILLPRDHPQGQGTLGIAMTRIGIERSNLFQALSKGAVTTAQLTKFTAQSLYSFFLGFFRGQSSLDNVSGPIGIVKVVGDYSRFGILFLIQLTALLSINLALINIIPIPGLDGGMILLLAIEKIKGSPLHWKVSQAIITAGLAFLILLVILVSYHDILKFK